MNIYLLRHAIAADADENTQDHQRPLTEKGLKKLKKIVRNFEKLELSFDLILTSPYVRARQTAEAVVDGMGLNAELLQESQNLTPLGYADKFVDEIIARGPVENILVVGHEPFLSEFIGVLLAGDASLRINMKKAGLCKLSTEQLSFGRCATLEWLMTPGQLSAV